MIVDDVLLPDMDHLGAGIGLLAVVGDRDRIELADRIVAFEDAARVFPGDRRAGLDLRPRDLRPRAAAGAALGDEIVDAALALGVAGIPVLHGRILDLRVLVRDQLDHRGVQLVLVALRRGAAFEIADIGALVGDQQGALELAAVARVDAEIGRQLHRAAHARRDVGERAVAEHGRIQRREEIVVLRHHACRDTSAPAPGCSRTASPNEQKMMPSFGELSLEGGRDRDAVEHRVDRDAGHCTPASASRSRSGMPSFS